LTEYTSTFCGCHTGLWRRKYTDDYPNT